jgi:hypothetical protein
MPANFFDLFLVVKLSKIWVLDDAKNVDSFGGIELEGFFDEVHAVGVDVRKVIGFVTFLSGVDQVKILFVDVDFQVFDLIRRGSPGPVKDSFNLVDGGGSRKHGLASHHLSNQTSQRPNIDFLRIVFTA